MATTEERLAALEAKMAQLTATTPTEYYTHQYSGEEIDAAVGRAVSGGALDTSMTNVSNQLGTFVRPNLLDNWYFGNPVNQRGQTSWTNPSDWQYSIDRWQITPSSVIALVDGGITITADFHQGLEKDRLEFGRTYTFSVLSSDGRLGKHTFVLTSDTDINIGFGFGYFVCFLGGNNVWFRIYGDGSTYKAAKLELGSTQTLAHQEGDKWILNEVPDYGEQLRRCQRYFVRTTARQYFTGFAYGNTAGVILVPTPVQMRVAPTIKVDEIGRIITLKETLSTFNLTVEGADMSGVKLLVLADNIAVGPIAVADTTFSLSADL